MTETIAGLEKMIHIHMTILREREVLAAVGDGGGDGGVGCDGDPSGRGKGYSEWRRVVWCRDSGMGDEGEQRTLITRNVSV